MIKYPFYKRFILSFYSKSLYVFVGKNEQYKSGFNYLFVLLLLLWIPEMVKIQVQISSAIKNDLPEFVEQLPVITIKNGVASMDRPSPYIIKDEKTGKNAMIFDMSGEYTALEGTDAKLLLTDRKFICTQSSSETRAYSLSRINDFTLTHEKIYSWASIGNFISILMYLFIIPVIFLYRAFQALIYSLIGLIIQSVLQTNYSFQTIYRLTILAITPAFVLNKVLSLFGIDFTGWSFLCLMISIGYLHFGLKANKDADIAAAEALSSAEFGTDNSSGNSGI